MAFVSSPTGLVRSSVRSSGFLSSIAAHTRINTSLTPIRRIQLTMAAAPTRTTVADTPQKEFLDRLKALKKVRIVVRNPTGILETVATFDSLFYLTMPAGEYANLIDHRLNLDMHILLSGFTGVKFEVGVSRSKSKAPLYTLRLLGEDKKTPAVSVFIMWDKDPDDIEQERIQAWKDLKADYVTGEKDTFFFNE